MKKSRYRLIGLGEALILWVASSADPLAHQVDHPFRNVAAWLRQVSPDLRSTDAKTISRGITVLSNSQRYVKSFDGIAYEVQGKLQEGATTSDIDAIREEAELYESKASAKKAAKLVELLVEVESALNAAEAAEIASQFDGAVMARYMRDARLRFLPSSPLSRQEDIENTDGDAFPEAIGVDREGTTKTPHGPGVSDGARAADQQGQKRGSKFARTPAGTARRSSRSKEGDHDDGDSSACDEQQRTKMSREPQPRGERAGPEDKGKEQEERDAGEEKTMEVFVNVVAAGCDVQCLVMVDDRDERLVVAVGDALTGEALLGSLFEEPAVVRLASHGLMRETAYVNRAVFQCACDILERAGPAIKASIEAGGAFEGYRVHCTGHSFGGAVAACLAGLLDGAIDVEAAESRGKGLQRGRPSREGENDGEDGDKSTSPRGKVDSDTKGPRKPGLSARGKSRDASESFSGREGHERGREGEEEVAVKVDEAVPWVGLCTDKVTCVTLGCPPCLSPNLRLPFVTSFVLGDDMVPRTSRESLRRLKRRLLQVMPRGTGLLSQGVAFGTSLFTDVAGVAMQGARQATTLGEDDARLAVPGRVWFTKPRRLKGGATLARVMDGNLREDMLWQLRDIMLTKSMLSHHRLDKYIKTLDRV